MNTGWRTDDLPTHAELEVSAYAAELEAKARARAARRGAPDANTTPVTKKLSEIERRIEAHERTDERIQKEAERLASRNVKALVAKASENVSKGTTAKNRPARASVVRSEEPGLARFFELVEGRKKKVGQ